MHGGAIASLIDSAGGLAARTLTHPVPVVTVEFKVNFLAPIRRGAVLADGQVIEESPHKLGGFFDPSGTNLLVFARLGSPASWGDYGALCGFIGIGGSSCRRWSSGTKRTIR